MKVSRTLPKLKSAKDKNVEIESVRVIWILRTCRRPVNRRNFASGRPYEEKSLGACAINLLAAGLPSLELLLGLGIFGGLSRSSRLSLSGLARLGLRLL